MKTLLKQIWFRRKSAAWLFIELTVLSVMAYLMSDQIIRLYGSFFPRGYDVDERIQVMSVTQKDLDGDMDTYRHDVFRCFEFFASTPGVKQALLLDDFSLPAGIANYNSGIYPDIYGGRPDEEQMKKAYQPARFMQTVSPDDYAALFSMFGIKLAEGSLENLPDDAIVITKDLADTMFPEGSAVGRRVSDGQTSFTVAAVTTPLQIGGKYQFYQPCAFIYGSADPETSIGDVFCFVFIPEDGVSPDRIAETFSKEILLPSNLEIFSMSDYGDIVRKTDSFSNLFPDERLWTLFLMFVLVFLGTVSYFWMNDRSCMDENGIRMSYGATRTALGGRYLLQAFVLVTAAFLTAFVIAMNMELFSGGIFYSSPFRMSVSDSYLFIENRWVALGIVSAVIYIGMLLTVSVGTLLCSLRLRGKMPVEMMDK